MEKAKCGRYYRLRQGDKKFEVTLNFQLQAVSKITLTLCSLFIGFVILLQTKLIILLFQVHVNVPSPFLLDDQSYFSNSNRQRRKIVCKVAMVCSKKTDYKSSHVRKCVEFVFTKNLSLRSANKTT